MMAMIHVDRILDRLRVSRPRMKARKRSPSNNLPQLFSHGDRVFLNMSGEPSVPRLHRLRLSLIGTSGMEDVVVVDVVDRWKIFHPCRPDRDAAHASPPSGKS